MNVLQEDLTIILYHVIFVTILVKNVLEVLLINVLLVMDKRFYFKDNA